MKYPESIEFSNIHELGKLNFTYHLPFGDEKNLKSPLPPIIKIQSQNGRNYVLETGVIDYNLNFHKCPISFHYVELGQITLFVNEYHHDGITISCEIKVYSEDYISVKIFNIALKGHGRPLYAVRILNNIINSVNLYINSGRHLDDLRQLVQTENSELGIDKKIILNIISSLSCTFYENCRYVPRNDNRFWNELEIGNLPTNKYLKDLLVECIKIRYGNNVYSEESCIIVTYNHYCAYSMSHGRHKIEFDQEYFNKVSDYLKVEMASRYDKVLCLFAQMELET